MSRKQPARARRLLRSLDARDLAAVTGGIIIYGSTALGGPDTAEAAGIIIYGNDPATGAIMFWRPGS